ncbi:TPA: hypothetical protein ACOFFI_003984 [Yersinia enterocolitica]
MLIEQIRKTRSKILAKTDTLGSYDFFTTIITLDGFDKKDLGILYQCRTSIDMHHKNKTPLEYDAYDSLARFYSIACHEYTHFLDCTSTLWGFRYLKCMSDAYSVDNLRFPEQSEENFHFAKKFSDYINYIKLPNYFTEIPKTSRESSCWHFSESIGNGFTGTGNISEHPVLFVRFLNENNELIVRSPISTLSILECSAMAQEIQYKVKIMCSLGDTSEFDIEICQYNRELKEYLYDRSITEYSVCAHLVSSFFGIQDAYEAFKFCAIICRYVLNTPLSAYDSIVESCDLSKIFGLEGKYEFLKRMKLGIKYKEPGFLFYLLCRAMKNNYINDISSELIISAYVDLGISKEDLRVMSNNELIELKYELSQSRIPYIVTVADAGIENYNMIESDNPSIDFYKMNIPPVILNCNTVVDVMSGDNNKLKGYDIDSLYYDLVKGQLWVERFTEACI